MKECLNSGQELELESISDRVRRLCKASLDSDLTESARILAYAYDEKNAAIQRMLGKLEAIE